MHTGVDLHVYYEIANTPVLPFPFPHLEFLGVEPIREAGARRDRLLYDIMIGNASAPPAGSSG